MPQAYTSIIMVNALSIRDVLNHTPTSDPTTSTVIGADASTGTMIAVDMHEYVYCVLKMVNTHNQIIRIQFFGNVSLRLAAGGYVSVATAAASNPDRLGVPVDVLASDSQTRIASINDASIMPIVFAQATALVLPTSGTLTIIAELFGTLQGL